MNILKNNGNGIDAIDSIKRQRLQLKGTAISSAKYDAPRL